eukprot:3128880-Pyramimonas_sp.AAC.2
MVNRINLRAQPSAVCTPKALCERIDRGAKLDRRKMRRLNTQRGSFRFTKGDPRRVRRSERVLVYPRRTRLTGHKSRKAPDFHQRSH